MAAENDLDFYRSQFFADPSTAVDSRFIHSTSRLLNSLVGVPAQTDTPASENPDELECFTDELTQRMQASRFFDHKSIAQLHPNGNIPAILAHIGSTLRNGNTVIEEASHAETAM